MAWSLVKHRGNFVLASVRCGALMDMMSWMWQNIVLQKSFDILKVPVTSIFRVEVHSPETSVPLYQEASQFHIDPEDRSIYQECYTVPQPRSTLATVKTYITAFLFSWTKKQPLFSINPHDTYCNGPAAETAEPRGWWVWPIHVSLPGEPLSYGTLLSNFRTPEFCLEVFQILVQVAFETAKNTLYLFEFSFNNLK